MDNDQKHNDVLCCPLCGSEEYLLSESDNMLCAKCGSFFEDVTQLATSHTSPTPNHQCFSIAALSH